MADPLGVSIAFDDATLTASPTWTRLDNPAGIWKVQSFTIDRGRTSELDQTGTGTATVRLIDTAGTLDPTYAAGTYYGKLNPLKQAAIALYNPVATSWSTIFRGFVEDWQYELDVSERFMTLDLQLVDGFDILNAAPLLPGEAGTTPPAGSEGYVFYEDEPVDDRIDGIRADAGWPLALTDFFTGNVVCQDTIYPPGTSALTALHDAADAEFPGVANIYMSKDGKLTFHGRFARFHPDVSEYHISQWKVGDITARNSDSNVAVISALKFNRGKEAIINSALATPQGIDGDDVAGQLVEDSTSITANGTRSWSAENLLTQGGQVTNVDDPLAETLLFSTYYVNNYKDPRTRVSQIVLRSRAVGDAWAAKVWQVLCGIDISDIVTLTTTHPGGGGFAAEDFYVEGLHYEARAMNATHHDVTLTLDVSPRAYFDSNPFE